MYEKLKRQLLALWRGGISMGSIGRLANFDRRPFSSEFDGIVKIFASPANWPQNAALSSRAPSSALCVGFTDYQANFMSDIKCWLEFALKLKRPYTQLHYLSACKAGSIHWMRAVEKEELRSLVRELLYDFPLYEESLSHLGQTQYWLQGGKGLTD